MALVKSTLSMIALGAGGQLLPTVAIAAPQNIQPALGFPVEILQSSVHPKTLRSDFPTPKILAQGIPDSSTTIGDTLSPDQVQQLRQSLLIEPVIIEAPRKSSPGSTLGSPSAYGAKWGNSFAGLSYASQPDNADKADGSAVLGMGFGDPVRAVGLEMSIGIISLTDSFADSGSVGFKLHKVIPEAGNLGVAVGWSNALKWGDAQQSKDTIYGVVTKRFALRPEANHQLPLTISLGAGTGGFRSNGAIKAGENTPNVFASAGLQVIPELSLISNWTGNQLNLGVSAAPFRQIPLVFSMGVSDVTNITDGGSRFLFNVGYSLNF